MDPIIELEGDENEVLVVGALPADPDVGSDVWLVGKVLAHHNVIVAMFKSVMQDLWTSRNCLEVRHAGQNLFTFKFSSTKDRDLVLQSGPWFFDRYIISLNVYGSKCITSQGWDVRRRWQRLLRAHSMGTLVGTDLRLAAMEASSVSGYGFVWMSL